VTVVTFSLFGFSTPRQRLWAFSQMGLAKPALRKIPELQFFKLMGTGSGAGFSTRPNFGVYTLLAEWPSMKIARERIDSADGLEGHRRMADRMATLYLEPVASRGQWDGHQFEVAADARDQRLPLVALTRASIRPSKLFRFWSRVPAISETVEREDPAFHDRDWRNSLAAPGNGVSVAVGRGDGAVFKGECHPWRGRAACLPGELVFGVLLHAIQPAGHARRLAGPDGHVRTGS
jgi:hypothetical protein